MDEEKSITKSSFLNGELLFLVCNRYGVRVIAGIFYLSLI